MRKSIVWAVIGLALCPTGTMAKTPVDWVYSGDSQLPAAGGDPAVRVHTFVLMSELKRLPKNHIQVWSKALAVDDTDKAELGKDVVGAAAIKVVNGYVPLFVTLLHLDGKQRVDIIALEAQANAALVSPRSQILWEIDCDNRLLRSLSITITNGKRFGSVENVASWSHSQIRDARRRTDSRMVGRRSKSKRRHIHATLRRRRQGFGGGGR